MRKYIVKTNPKMTKKDNDMIAEYLKKNKVTVIEHKPLEGQSGYAMSMKPSFY